MTTKSNSQKIGSKKKIIVLIVSIISVSILVAVMICNFVGKDTKDDTTVPTTKVEEAIEGIVIDGDITESTDVAKITTEKEEILTLEEPTTKKVTTTVPKQHTTEKSADPVIQNTNADIIQNDNVNEYSCGANGHRCDSKEIHNFIVGLEAKGCEYCGSHSCPSFYATDEWGQAGLDVTKCPEYNKKSDPLYYCQDCGKKVGTGSNGTCITFTVDMQCPECGELVKARTCHSH